MTDWTTKLNAQPFRTFPGLFSTLDVPEIDQIKGQYQGSFVGPRWLRSAAGPALVLSGLGGWWGKHFKGDGTAMNLVQHSDQLEPSFPMTLVPVTSVIDGRTGLALNYGAENPFPWPHIVDELRRLDQKSLLGMTYVNTQPLQKLAFPFLLEYQE